MDDNPWVTCPYDKAHRVLISHIQRHLLKCEKKYPKLEICPYNYTHRFPKSEIYHHIAFDCPSKDLKFETKEDNLSKVEDYIPKRNQILQPEDPDQERWD